MPDTLVCAENLNPDVVVMKPAENGAAKNTPYSIYGARERRILLQRQVRPYLIVIFHVRQQHMTKMLLA